MAVSRNSDNGRHHITGLLSMLMLTRLGGRKEFGNGSEEILTEKVEVAELLLFLRVLQHPLTTRLLRGFPRGP